MTVRSRCTRRIFACRIDMRKTIKAISVTHGQIRKITAQPSPVDDPPVNSPLQNDRCQGTCQYRSTSEADMFDPHGATNIPACVAAGTSAARAAMLSLASFTISIAFCPEKPIASIPAVITQYSMSRNSITGCAGLKSLQNRLGWHVRQYVLQNDLKLCPPAMLENIFVFVLLRLQQFLPREFEPAFRAARDGQMPKIVFAQRAQKIGRMRFPNPADRWAGFPAGDQSVTC